ncbi:hypothetical protein K438DRAFT_1778532 [Mycena galopus ATCC 62051]|nr:hypothetical protein K438DRAFT_1778532 [Mycena galopus ATCC 62051]
MVSREGDLDTSRHSRNSRESHAALDTKHSKKLLVAVEQQLAVEEDSVTPYVLAASGIDTGNIDTTSTGEVQREVQTEGNSHDTPGFIEEPEPSTIFRRFFGHSTTSAILHVYQKHKRTGGISNTGKSGGSGFWNSKYTAVMMDAAEFQDEEINFCGRSILNRANQEAIRLEQNPQGPYKWGPTSNFETTLKLDRMKIPVTDRLQVSEQSLPYDLMQIVLYDTLLDHGLPILIATDMQS